jgi:hypothetical protein
MVSRSSKSDPSGFKKWKYNPLCEANKEASSVRTQCWIEGEIVSEESSNEKSWSGTSVDGWTVGDKKPQVCIFTKNVGPKFNFLPDTELLDYFSLFFSHEFLITLL